MVEIKITTKKSVGFYIRAVATFIRGTDDKPPVEQVQVTALGNAISAAAAVVGAIERDGLAKAFEIKTNYLEMKPGVSPQLSVTLQACRPIAIILEVEIKKECVEEFLKVMEADAQGSRAEPGCLRFDLLRDEENPCKFITYEVFESAAAIEAHRDMPHTKAWGAFQYGDKKPVVNKKLSKTEAINFQFRNGTVPTAPAKAILLQVSIKEEHVAEFANVMTGDASGSRKEDGCLRFDLLRDQENKNKFFTYEVFESAAAMDVHKEKPYVKAWGAFQYGDLKPVTDKVLVKAETVNFQGR